MIGRLATRTARSVVFGASSGLLAGLSAWVFLEGLDRVTRFRVDHKWIVWLLPIAGAVLGLMMARVAGRAALGTPLVVETVRRGGPTIPGRMAPVALLGSLVAHLFGASVGREGVGLQMSGALTDQLAARLRLGDRERRTMLVASLAAGFGAVFGVPWAGTVFALEVCGGRRRGLVMASLAAAFTGDAVTRVLGFHHQRWPEVHPGWRPADPLRWLVLAAGAAVLAGVFGRSVPRIKRRWRTGPRWLRAAIGGTLVLAIGLVAGREYFGLGTPLAVAAVGGAALSFRVPLLKLAVTALSLGAGFPGGEVTPLFVMGATLGSAMAGPLGLPVPAAAAVGFVSVFAAAANVPMACTVLGIELFGWAMAPPLLLVCVMARLMSGRHSIYGDL